MKEETKSVPFRENYIFVTLFMFLFFGSMVSLFPYEYVVKWLIFNGSFAILVTIVNYIIWIYQKHDSKRYYSLNSFVMLIVLTYYFMSPAFKILYPSVFFWILLAGTLGFTIVLFLNRINIARGILNPGELWFKKLLLIYLVIFVCFVIGLFVYVNLLNLYSGEIMAVAIFLYFVGFLFLSLSPVFLTSPEMAKKLENMPVD